jgi:hypothetical protein
VKAPSEKSCSILLATDRAVTSAGISGTLRSVAIPYTSYFTLLRTVVETEVMDMDGPNITIANPGRPPVLATSVLHSCYSLGCACDVIREGDLYCSDLISTVDCSSPFATGGS